MATSLGAQLKANWTGRSDMRDVRHRSRYLLLQCSLPLWLDQSILSRRVTVEKRTAQAYVPAGGSDPKTFWAAESQKGRVAPARFSLFSTVTFAGIAFRISFGLNK